MNAEDSIFTKITKGDIPSHKVYEDEKTLAFLNIYPAVDGHVLVISKTQVPYLWDLADGDYAAVMTTVKKVAKRLREVMETERVGVKVIGIDVPHAHVHLLPFDDPRDYYNHETKDEPNHAALAALAEKLYFTD